MTLTATRAWIERLDREAEDFAEEVARALRRAIKAGTSKLGHVLTAQGEPAEPLTSLDDLTAIEAAWRVEVVDTVIPAVERFMREGADHALEELAARAPVLLDMRHPEAELHLTRAENRLVGIGTDVWQRTRDQLVVGFQNGESIPELSKRVREVMAASEVRARTIARTEVISASNAGSLAQVRLLGDDAPVAKTWLSTNDSRTRATHRQANDQSVPLDAKFTVGGASLDFPGDPTGPPDEVINCRCTLTWETTSSLADVINLVATGVDQFPVKHDPKSGRFLPGGRSKRPPKIVYEPGSGGKSVSEKKREATKKAKPKKKLAPGEFGEGDNFDREAADEFGEEGFKKWRQGLTPAQKTSMKAYTDTSMSKGINDRLRRVPLDAEDQGRVATLDKHAKNLTATFDRPGARTPRAVTTHRVMQGPLAERIIQTHRRKRLVTDAGGAKFRDDGLISTSLNRSVAQKSSAPKNQRVNLEIQVPKGQRAIYPGSMSKFANESELILPPGTRFEVQSAGTKQGVLTLQVTISE